jgi:type IV pilus assembly protein PilM
MATNKPVWGVDLGQNALKAIRLRLAGEVAEAVDYAYIEHSRILSSQQDTAARATMIADTMKKFLEQHNLSKENIVVAVPGQHTLARFVKLPPADKKRIPELVKYEAQQQIPFDMEEVIWDYQVFGNSPEGFEVGIFAMRREVLREHLRFLSDLNLEPAAVQSAPLALYSALRFDGIAGAEPAVILDIGAQNSDLIISDGESLWTRNIPIGGNHFTESLLKTFKLSFNKAENLKRTAASSKYARQIFQAMRPVFADLVAEIQRSIGFFTGSRRGVKLTKVIAMGNAFQLPGMVKFIQQNLGMDVVRPTSFSKLSASEAPNAPDLLKQLGTFGVAYGLALQGLGKAQITSSLLPTDIAKQIVWRKKTPWFYGAAACLVLSASVFWARTMMDSNAVAAVTGEPIPPPSFTVGTEDIKGLKVPKPDPQAVNIVEKGPSTANPLGYANAVLAASQHLADVEKQLLSINDNDITKIQEVAALETSKTIWPKILYKLHAALPQDELTRALAEGPEQYQALIAKDPDKYARGKRKVIFIDKMISRYSPDVISLAQALQNPAGGTPQAAGNAPTTAALPGFLITIEGHTPNEGGPGFVADNLVNRLAPPAPKDAKAAGAAAPAAKKDSPSVYFDNVVLLSCQKKKQATDQGPNTGLGRDTTYGSSMAPQRDESKDPILPQESVERDWEFRIQFVAVLGEKPAGSPAPASARPGEAQ